MDWKPTLNAREITRFHVPPLCINQILRFNLTCQTVISPIAQQLFIGFSYNFLLNSAALYLRVRLYAKSSSQVKFFLNNQMTNLAARNYGNLTAPKSFSCTSVCHSISLIADFRAPYLLLLPNRAVELKNVFYYVRLQHSAYDLGVPYNLDHCLARNALIIDSITREALFLLKH